MINENFEFLNIFTTKKISYNNYPELHSKEVEQIQVSDDINFDYGEAGMKITVDRKVWFEPVSIFDIEVSIETYLDKKENFEYDPKALSVEELINEFEGAINSLCAKISTIISTMTMFANDAPLVTPPSLICLDD